MHGVAEGKQITLFDCFTTWVPHVSADNSARIVVNIVAFGDLIESTETGVASALSFTTPEMIRWANLRGLTYNSNKEVKATYSGKRTMEVHAEGATVQFSTGIKIETSSVSELNLVERNGVRIAFDQPQSILDIDRWVTKVCRLISLALRCPTVCRVYELEQKKGGPITIVTHSSKSVAAETKMVHPLFIRPKRQALYARVLRSWFAEYDKLEPVISLRVALLSQPAKFREFEFLTYVQAVEALHRRTRPARTLVDKKQYADLHGKLVEAIPSHWETKAEFVNKLRYLNEISLADRLRDVFAYDKELLGALFRDEAKDVALIKDLRNYFTHYDGKKSERVLAYIGTTKFYYLTAKVLLLLEIAMLREIGFSQAEVRSLIQNDPTYRDLCRADHSR